MVETKIVLPRECKGIEVHTIADLHIGDPRCDLEGIKRKIDTIASKDDAYCIINGDIVNNATRNSVSDIYGEKMSPMQQLQTFVDLCRPIKGRILAVTQGNHEERTYKQDGIDLTAVAAKEIGVLDRYSPTGVVAFVYIGDQGGRRHHRQYVYIIYATHGRGGGRREGAKLIRLIDLASIVDADIYIHGHTHLPMIARQAYYRADASNGLVKVDRLFVNCGSALDYGGYGEVQGYKPSSKESPIIYLDGTRKYATATL